ncbi:FecR family protein [Chryseolinea soli]|uniref:FecR family protein n=1 Tax=Chryseolinea soli TaxID=2321403 RepID=A0A385SNQ7_9BACT|nr:FecR family protein [Chryseolinea soli]AYB32614.1 FecR family protein [Chryseolinea soli]
MRENPIPRKEFDKILVKYQKGTCTPEEQALVQQWYDSIGKDVNFSMDEDRQQQLEESLWQKLSFRMHDQKEKESLGGYWKIAGVAAALFICVGVGFYLGKRKMGEGNFEIASGTETVITNDENEPKVVTLEDGSVVTLQPSSTIRLAKPFKKERRELQLTGMAFFEVAHDQQRPFLVYTKNVITKVLGTSFSVQAAKDDQAIVVAVRTGRVSVSRQVEKNFGLTKSVKEEAILVPNQRAIFNLKEEKVTTTLVEDPQPVAKTEKAQVLKFDEKPVVAILKTLEKMYAVEILYDEKTLQSCELTTVFSEEGLYERLRIICKAIDGTFEVQGTRIVLQSHGCAN